MMRIAIAGRSGLLGRAVAQDVRSQKHEVISLVRRPAQRLNERFWDPERGHIDAPGLADTDVVINFSGAGIADARWTPERKREILRSRVDSTRTLAAALAEGPRTQRFLSGSAIGFYGDAGDRIVDEKSPRGAGFLADVVEQWEAAAAGAGVPTVLLRTGHVITRHGGLVGKQLPLFRAGLGGRFGSGRQYLSWISMPDYLRAISLLITADITGPVNLVSPNPVTNAEFTRILAGVLHRPAIIPVPLLAVKALFGRELVDEAMLGSTRVKPSRLLDLGFVYEQPTLVDALR